MWVKKTISYFINMLWYCIRAQPCAASWTKKYEFGDVYIYLYIHTIADCLCILKASLKSVSHFGATAAAEEPAGPNTFHLLSQGLKKGAGSVVVVGGGLLERACADLNPSAV